MAIFEGIKITFIVSLIDSIAPGVKFLSTFVKMIIPHFLLLVFTMFLFCEKSSSSDLTEPLLGRKAALKSSEAQVYGHRTSSSSSSRSETRESSPTNHKPASPKKKTAKEIHIEKAIKHEKEAEHHTSERLKWKEKGEQSDWTIYRMWSEVKMMDHADKKSKSLAKAKMEREKAEQAKQHAGTSRS